MNKVAIITDTNSGMPQEMADSLGVYMVSMPFIVDGKEYFEGVDCTYAQFFEMLRSGSDVSTSQPSPESVTALWDEVLKTHDAIVHIPMSSGLSSSCATVPDSSSSFSTCITALCRFGSNSSPTAWIGVTPRFSSSVINCL